MAFGLDIWVSGHQAQKWTHTRDFRKLASLNIHTGDGLSSKAEVLPSGISRVFNALSSSGLPGAMKLDLSAWPSSPVSEAHGSRHSVIFSTG